jgi:peroxiredoxin Q/BCP
MIPQTGTPAPDFSLPDETGKIHKLSDYRGKKVLLYFYPEDGTSGCTTEACNFRDDYSMYQKAGITILGLSPDSMESHVNFKAQHHLPYPLLADVGHKVCNLFGTWGPKEKMGKTYDGVYRTTFLIDTQGIITQVFENVNPAEHSKEILASLP